MTVSTLSATERQTKLETLATIDAEILAGITVRELRKMVSGVIPSANKLVKSDLLDLIADRTTDIRQALQDAKQIALIAAEETQEKLAELTAASLSQATPEGYRSATGITSHQEVIKDVREQLESIAVLSEQKQDTPLAFTTKVGSVATNYLLLLNTCYAPTTRKSNVTEMNNALYYWVDGLGIDIYKDNKKNAVDVFKSSVKYSMNNLNKTISNDYLLAVKTRTDSLDDLKKVTSQPIIDRAVMALETLADYRDVAIALAIVTGRRMGEILSTLKIHGAEGNILLVSGLAKAKTDKETANSKIHRIPVLASSELIINALAYLETNGRRLDKADEVNDKYGKTFSRHMAKWTEVIGVASNFKSLRALYAELCYKRYGSPEGRRKVNYLAEILGHSEKDLTTAGSYEVWNVID